MKWPRANAYSPPFVVRPPCQRAGFALHASQELLARVVRLTDNGSVIYHAEKDHCGRFPGPASGDLRSGPGRNFQVFSALDCLAEVTQHIPDKGEHLVSTLPEMLPLNGVKHGE